MKVWRRKQRHQVGSARLGYVVRVSTGPGTVPTVHFVQFWSLLPLGFKRADQGPSWWRSTDWVLTKNKRESFTNNKSAFFKWPTCGFSHFQGLKTGNMKLYHGRTKSCRRFLSKMELNESWTNGAGCRRAKQCQEELPAYRYFKQL